MKTAFAILIFTSLQTLGAFAQEVTVPPPPPPSCNSPQYNPSLSFLSSPDATYDEKLTTGSIAAATIIADKTTHLPSPKQLDVKKATHKRKKQKHRKKTMA